MQWKFAISRCKILYIGWIDKVLWYSIGYYIQYPMRNHNGQGSLACCSKWGRKKLDMTERLNNKPQWKIIFLKMSIYVFNITESLSYAS